MSQIEVNQTNGLPAIGTVEDPSFIWKDRTAYLAYQIAPVDGSGCALLRFRNVIEASIIPLNTEGLFKNTSGPYVPEFPIKPWEVNEIRNDSKTVYWKALNARRWQISFEDWTVDIISEQLELLTIDKNTQFPEEILHANIEKLD
ncbi:hypothetical protein [Cohaesibacter celericrescens]|uniref:hypothetical protein n=1 Tax=Cohaesibacter celericrescens TaxID=2067669 RepID=UPI00356B4A70